MTYGTNVDCACGALATANGRECPACYRDRLLGISNHYTPTRTEGSNPTAQATWDRRLDDYASVRAEGIQPRSTSRAAIEEAKQISDQIQAPFDAGRMSTTEVG